MVVDEEIFVKKTPDFNIDEFTQDVMDLDIEITNEFILNHADYTGMDHFWQIYITDYGIMMKDCATQEERYFSSMEEVEALFIASK